MRIRKISKQIFKGQNWKTAFTVEFLAVAYTLQHFYINFSHFLLNVFHSFFNKKEMVDCKEETSLVFRFFLFIFSDILSARLSEAVAQRYSIKEL